MRESGVHFPVRCLARNMLIGVLNFNRSGRSYQDAHSLRACSRALLKPFSE